MSFKGALLSGAGAGEAAADPAAGAVAERPGIATCNGARAGRGDEKTV